MDAMKKLERALKIKSYTPDDIITVLFAKKYGVEAVPSIKKSPLYKDLIEIEKGKFSGELPESDVDADYILLQLVTYQTVKNYMKSKQAFCFDKDMISELSNTNADITFPKDVLSCLPCDTFCLDFSSNEEICKKLDGYGFIVDINKISAEKEETEEYLLTYFKLSEKSSKNGSISPCILRLLDSGNEIDLKKLLSKENNIKEDVFINNLIIQSLIYLSSIEPDIRETEASKASQASYRKQKQKSRKKIEKPIQTFAVGERFGEAFRAWTKGQLDSEKAHWHRYWIGKNDNEEKKLAVKWVHQCICEDNERRIKNDTSRLQKR